MVLTRERLREALKDKAEARFSRTPTATAARSTNACSSSGPRYDALMDTLIQLRQPQLSKEARRSRAVATR
jgi:hypothetical protein